MWTIKKHERPVSKKCLMTWETLNKVTQNYTGWAKVGLQI